MENTTTVPAGAVAGLRPPANRVSPKAIAFWTVRAAFGWLVLTAAQVFWLAQDDWTGQAHVTGLVITGIAAVAHLVVMPQWRYRVHRWEVTPDAVYTQAGWINQERRIAPVSRIQTVDTQRGPFENLFGLTNITVTTASARGPVKIHGLDSDEAQRLAADLLTNTQATPGDAT